MAKASITQDRLKEVLHYNPETGVFTWIKSINPRAPIGHNPKSVNSSGYLRIRIDNSLYYAHQLAFLYMDGKFPPKQVDHINGIRTDNKWTNLRSVSHSENGKNQRLQPKNKSGYPGVFWCNTQSRWIARIKVNGKNIHIAQSKSKDFVVSARKAAEVRYGFHANHGSHVTTD